MEKKITSKDYSDYHIAYSNAFDLNNNGSVSLLTQKEISSEENNYLYNYLSCTQNILKPGLTKSFSWSASNSAIRHERDCYLSPYAWREMRHYQQFTEEGRRRSHTLPTNSPAHFATVDFSQSSQLSNSNLLSSQSSLEAKTSSTCPELSELSELHIEPINRLRSNSVPPSISVTSEDGLSTQIVNSLTSCTSLTHT